MGTHPIFESDFDCLTDLGNEKKHCSLLLLCLLLQHLLLIDQLLPRKMLHLCHFNKWTDQTEKISSRITLLKMETPNTMLNFTTILMTTMMASSVQAACNQLSKLVPMKCKMMDQ